MTNSKIQSPHDKTFKKSLEHFEVAVQFLQEHLPTELQTHIDWQSMQRQEGSLISAELKGTACDVLYKVKLFNRDAYIYLLVEHQSTRDKLMSFRILRYITQIIEQHLNQHKMTQHPIPLVIPLVFYSGLSEHTPTTDITQLVNAPMELVQEFFLQPYLLVELRNLDNEHFRKYPLSGLLEASMQYAITNNEKNFTEIFPPLARVVEQSEVSGLIKILVEYILNVVDHPRPGQFVEYVASTLKPETQVELMTMAARLAEEGRKEGRKEGLKEGMTMAARLAEDGRKEGKKEGLKEGMTMAARLAEDGRKEGKKEGLTEGLTEGIKAGERNRALAIARSLLAEGMSIKKVAEITKLDEDEIQEIQR